MNNYYYFLPYYTKFYINMIDDKYYIDYIN